MQFDCIADIRGSLTESPVWDDRRGMLFCCDILDRIVYEIDLEKGVSRQWHFETEVASLGLCESGRLVIALAREVILFDPETGNRQVLCTPGPEPETNRFNDGKVGPDGCFWVGSMDDRPQKETLGRLYRIDAQGNHAVMAEGFKVSNGLAWSPDGGTLYHSDSRGPHIDHYEFDPGSGALGKRCRFADLDEATGRPDGGACDADGCYWSAGVSAGVLNRFDRDGNIIKRHKVPAPAPTMPCFCGPDLKTLAVTSHRAVDPQLLGRFPQSGSVFAARSAVAGTPVFRMKGV
ncbi:SMP-30/gluconolactonase/LRE family protein [Mesorhizobium sp. DCY119]|uniref:SMP-30/gluconolactonase/LRE family protein n=1 Tax=Mesorhizobium sp. DCY119 TaxID=2108445 RepID=UPI000E720798|nr:SMP-30/gluconolactonase/LRE family protein [Mesorhizobium sp. DCY119]RJG41291.1 SMP-30/gluconolactonase/LRE family protein [Mesorhizobium sp. DCY119]